MNEEKRKELMEKGIIQKVWRVGIYVDNEENWIGKKHRLSFRYFDTKEEAEEFKAREEEQIELFISSSIPTRKFLEDGSFKKEDIYFGEIQETELINGCW